ncbi:hypothetical protein PENSPDRAFT_557223, partial [Peniophora sp. CONT]
FLSGHPQSDTHVVKIRGTAHLPVLSGPFIPRPDADKDARERFSRAMLILLKPWRDVEDLLDGQETWTAAYNAHEFPVHLQRIIRNIHVEKECKDARTEYSRARRQG